MNDEFSADRHTHFGLRDQIRSIGFTNGLIHFEANAFGQLDLDRAHPGGIAQLATSRKALLSNLFRDPLAFSKNYLAAKRIKDRADLLESQFGVSALALVGGLVNLTHAGFDFSLPILVWPIALHRKTDDFEVEIGTQPVINPGLVDALRRSCGVQLNRLALLDTLAHSTDLVPIALLSAISEAVGTGVNLEVRKNLVVGNFSIDLLNLDLDYVEPQGDLLEALTGHDGLANNAEVSSSVLLVSEADSVQHRVVERAVAGHSFAVETLPGCGYTQTLANTVAALAHEGQRVLVLAPRRQTLNELADRFSHIGLAGLGVRTSGTWLDVISAISRHEKASQSNLDIAKVRYEVASSEIQRYFDLLVKEDSKIGITLTEALEQLAKLSLLPHPPTTAARIPSGDLITNQDRTTSLELLQEAFDLGEFALTPDETAWFLAKFSSEEEAASASALAKKLLGEFDLLSEQIKSFVEKVGFAAPTSVEDWGNYLRLFSGVRETLGRFVPEVFERQLGELITATGPRVGKEMSGSTRRRLKKVAKEYLRPGMHVADLHEALVAIEEQSKQWKAFGSDASSPSVPAGISEVWVSFQSFMSDLATLQQHVDSHDDVITLARRSPEKLRWSLESMATDDRALQNLQARNDVRTRLEARGLTRLARSLAELKVRREHIHQEFELSWWQSALEYLIARDHTLMTYTRDQIDQIESNYKDAGADVVAAGATQLAAALSAKWQSALTSHPLESESLKALLKTRSASLSSITDVAPSIAPLLLQVVLASPYELASKLHPNDKFDVVIIADAAGTTLAENYAGIRRSAQVIAFGDEAIAAPDGFEIECNENDLPHDFRSESIFANVRNVFGSETLRKSWRPNGQTLGSVINREFYQNRIQFLPTPGEFLGRTNLSIEVLRNGVGVSSSATSLESPDAEVQRVIEMVLTHAQNSPEQSLLVATASKLHAERLSSEISAKRRKHPELEEWFSKHGREKFEITRLATLSHRIADRIIFSIGFGSDGAGKAPALLGDLSAFEGRRYLANLLVSARARLDIVSCFSAGDLTFTDSTDAGRLLAEVLGSNAANAGGEANPDPLLEDLALRLRKLGAHVVENFGDQLPLVVSYANQAATVYPDWALQGDDLNEKIRLRPALLEAMGWQVARVHSFDLFSDPQALAIRIAESIGMAVTKRPQRLFDDVASFEDTDAAWSERTESNDQRLRNDKPPHWG